jgi:APA family basic amino acid/polyamine antiporter
MLFIVAAAALVGNTIATQPVRAAVGIGVVLLGLPVYFIWRGSKRETQNFARRSTQKRR